jgi:hypothetical protein
MIKILINKLGRIRNAEVVIKPFMVFTGDSGLGKSYTAFLIDYLYNVIASDRIKFFVRERMKSMNKDEQDKGFSFRFGELREWMNNDVSQYLGYLIGNDSFNCDVEYVFDFPDKEVLDISVAFPDNYIRLSIGKKNVFFPKEYDEWENMYCLTINASLCVKLLQRQNLKPILLPPARGAFMGTKNAESIGMYKGKLIPLLDRLSNAPQRRFADNELFHDAIQRLTGGELIAREGSLYLSLASGQTVIPISAAASSVKELAPLLRLLQIAEYLDDYSVLFEEPEAHVHPKNQDALADLIVRMLRHGMQFQITTHSDYLLSRFNQLIRFGKMWLSDKERFELFCEENQIAQDLYLLPDEVAAYYFFEGADGNVCVNSQETSNGIPFTTFHDIVTRQERVDEQIESMMEG